VTGISVQVIQPHGFQALGLVHHIDTGVTMILHYGAGRWLPVAGMRSADSKVTSVPAGFTLDDSIERRLTQTLDAVKAESLQRGCGIAISTPDLNIVTT
jgi:hypothetical protein